MAATEKLVHLPKPEPDLSEFVKFRIHFGRVKIHRVALGDVPFGWNGEPVSGITQKIGDEWAKSGKTAILAVPSVLYPEETNFVLNPAHPEFRLIRISPAEPFAFDPRPAKHSKP